MSQGSTCHRSFKYASHLFANVLTQIDPPYSTKCVSRVFSISVSARLSLFGPLAPLLCCVVGKLRRGRIPAVLLESCVLNMGNIHMIKLYVKLYVSVQSLSHLYVYLKHIHRHNYLQRLYCVYSLSTYHCVTMYFFKDICCYCTSEIQQFARDRKPQSYVHGHSKLTQFNQFFLVEVKNMQIRWFLVVGY